MDPPFNSNRTYNAIYKDETGRPLPAQIEAFCDLWALDEESERAIRTMPVLMREADIEDEAVKFWRLWVNALRASNPKMLAHLSYMVQRFVVMKRLLRSTGSIYLHCDPTASHYIKVMMDGIFGHENFLNEIIWSYRTGGVSKHWFGRKHDTLLFYAGNSKKKHTFNVLKERFYNRDFKPYRLKGVEEFKDNEGEWYTMASMRDVWEINAIGRSSKERLGYATQKPAALLERIIKASTNEGDVVPDPFCGCATTLEAAHSLKRKWIGIDIAIHAIKRVAAIRLGERCKLKAGRDFKIDGIPRTLEGAKDLWTRDRYHFQKWAVEEVDGFVTAKRTADGGIDGRLYFGTHDKHELQSMIIEVKGGKNVTITELRALRGVLENEEALMAGLIAMEPLSARKMQSFQQFASETGDLEIEGSARVYPKMQILSVPEILEASGSIPYRHGLRLSIRKPVWSSKEADLSLYSPAI